MGTATVKGAGTRLGSAPDGDRVPTKRRWRVPPPLLQDGEGPGPEGLGILEEFRNELGAVLWKTLRSVILWAETDSRSRGELFETGAAERRQIEILSATPDGDPGPVREALENLLPLLDHPERVDPELVGLACTRIATWADAHAAPTTALEYLQAAAVCVPADARYALTVGRAARDLRHYGRAEAWIYRAVGLARQGMDWQTYVHAYLTHGKMMLRRGALPAARESIIKALRRARRQGFREGEAAALWDLFVVEQRAGNRSQAFAFAELAVHRHRRKHPALPRLAHDIARFWLEGGDAEHALPVLLETHDRIEPAGRPAVLGSIARAAALDRDTGAYDWARSELERYEPCDGLADAWAEVARGAVQLGRAADAEDAAQRAESTARALREGKLRFLAPQIMKEIESELDAGRSPRQTGEASRDTVTKRLARELIRSLQRAPEREEP